jgi:hypothetical protein
MYLYSQTLARIEARNISNSSTSFSNIHAASYTNQTSLSLLLERKEKNPSKSHFENIMLVPHARSSSSLHFSRAGKSPMDSPSSHVAISPCCNYTKSTQEKNACTALHLNGECLVREQVDSTQELATRKRQAASTRQQGPQGALYSS